MSAVKPSVWLYFAVVTVFAGLAGTLAFQQFSQRRLREEKRRMAGERFDRGKSSLPSGWQDVRLEWGEHDATIPYARGTRYFADTPVRFSASPSYDGHVYVWAEYRRDSETRQARFHFGGDRRLLDKEAEPLLADWLSRRATEIASLV